MRVQARGIDPLTGEPDRHGIPQIACPARQGDVNPQFTCRSCPCASGMETHQAIDDLGQPFHIVEAVECSFEGADTKLPAHWQSFPNLLAGVVEGVPPRVEPGVVCPLLSAHERTAPVMLEIEGARWVPAGHCRTCQFYRRIEGEQTAGSPGEDAGIGTVCAAQATG